MGGNSPKYIIIPRDIIIREYDIRTAKGNRARKPRLLKEGKKLLFLKEFLSTNPFRHGMYYKLLDEVDGYTYLVYTKDVEQVTEKTEIKDWYIKTFPTDELGNRLKSGITFKQAFNNLSLGSAFYDFTGIEDSIIRERVFEQLSKVYGVSYDYIYNKWMS